jgi:N-acetylglutamate synthase-like GNAT family acetyltransferase
VSHVRTAELDDLDDVRRLLREYADTLPFALDFQGFDEELATLPGRYAPPDGALLVARESGRAVGCVGIRALDETTCEMKRLYVSEPARGSGLGRVLAEASIAEARRLGYRRMRLDTVPGMETAQALYARLGFREIAPYTANPVLGACFLELEL